MKLTYVIILAAITVLPLYSIAQNTTKNPYPYTFLPHFEFKIESGITQLLIQGDYSLKLDSEINSNLTHTELINHSENRKIKPGTFLGAGVNYHLNKSFSFGFMYKMARKQIVDETGAISSIRVIGPNTITTKSSGNYAMVSELNHATIMASVASNFFIAKRNAAVLVLNYGVSGGYSNIKAVTDVPNAQFNLSMYSDSFQPEVEVMGGITKEEVKKNDYCWSVFSNVSLQFINAPNLSIGYEFTRLGEITLLERTPASVHLIQSYLSNNEENSNTVETLALVTTNSRLKLFSHMFSVSIIF